MEPDWDDLKVFLAVARGESLSAAAKVLKRDPATVGRRVARLEEALGDPQAEARAQFLHLADPSGRLDGLQVPSVAFRMSGSETGVSLPPQPVGAQTSEILRSVGLGDDEIEALCLAGLALQAPELTLGETVGR